MSDTYILIPTPLDHAHSELSAHIIEHCAFAEFYSPEKYWSREFIEGSTYTFYSHYTIHNRELTEIFLEALKTPISKAIFQSEYSRIYEELHGENEYKRIIERVGKHLLGKYRYGKCFPISQASVQKYQTKWFTEENIRIYSSESLSKRTPLKRGDICSFSGFSFGIDSEKYLCIITTELSPWGIYMLELLEELYDFWLDCEDIKNGKYFTRSIIQGEHPGNIWLCTTCSGWKTIENLSLEFLNGYISFRNKKPKEQHVSGTDWLSLFFYNTIYERDGLLDSNSLWNMHQTILFTLRNYSEKRK